MRSVFQVDPGLWFLTSSWNRTLMILFFGVVFCERCSTVDGESNNEICEPKFPIIVFETDQDSVRIGETFTVKISLSDTSFLTFTEPGLGTRRAPPIFRINGGVVKEYFRDEYVDSEPVIDTTIIREIPGYREVAVGIIFPHPGEMMGAVELQRKITYIAVPD